MSLETKIHGSIISRRAVRDALGLDETVPFSQYAVYVAWHNASVPDSQGFLDFQNNRYSKSGTPCHLSDISDFIRLSSATKWQDGRLVEVGDNIPRISGEGLLIEPQTTNSMTLSNLSTRDGNFKISSVRQGVVRVESLVDLTDETSVNRRVNEIIYPLGGGVENAVRGLLLEATSSGVKVELGGTTKATSLVVDKDGVEVSLPTVSSAWANFEDGVMRMARVPSAASMPRQIHIRFGSALVDGGLPVSQIGDWVEIGFPYYSDEHPNWKRFSLILAEDVPTTRSPDILNIPLLPTQSIAGDWDEGITYEVADNIATFTGHGYIRNITVETL